MTEQIGSNGPEPRRRPASSHAHTIELRLRPREARIILAEMVKAETQAGVLRYSRRRKLVGYASKMGIARPEAQLIIAQVLGVRHSGQPFEMLSAEEIDDQLTNARRCAGAMRKILTATIAAAAVNLLMIRWLLY